MKWKWKKSQNIQLLWLLWIPKVPPFFTDLASVNRVQARNSGVALGGKYPFFGSSPVWAAASARRLRQFLQVNRQRRRWAFKAIQVDGAFAGGSAQPQDQQEHPAPLQGWMKWVQPSLIRCQESLNHPVSWIVCQTTMQNMWNVTWLSFIDLGIDSKCSSSGLMNSQWTRQQSCTVDWLSLELVNKNCTNQSSYLTKVLALDGSIWKTPWRGHSMNSTATEWSLWLNDCDSKWQRGLTAEGATCQCRGKNEGKAFHGKTEKRLLNKKWRHCLQGISESKHISTQEIWPVLMRKGTRTRAYKANGCQDSQKLEPYTTGHLDLTKNCDCGRLTCKRPYKTYNTF